MKTKQNPLEFIKYFQNEGTMNVFLNGCCYWFAFILYTRFIDNYARLMYNYISGHFATMIDDKLYDITGEIKNPDDKWIPFDEYQAKEPNYTKVIIRDCILKYPNWNNE